jgi:serine/threonine-protein kinase RsbW
MTKQVTKKNKNINPDTICAVGDFKELSRIRDFVFARALDRGFSDGDAQKIVLAVDEACTNLIEHAFKLDKSRNICVTVELEPNTFTVNIIDDGKPFDPTGVSKPDMDQYFKQFKKGGLGIHLMRSVMDEISYTPSTSSGDSKNILRLSKQIATA